MIELLFICFGTAGLTHFLDMCFNEGMIFHGYYKFIEEKFCKKPNPCDSDQNKYMWLFKVLGGCSYCFGTWIFLGCYTALITEFSGLIVLGLGLNYVFMKLIEKI